MSHKFTLKWLLAIALLAALTAISHAQISGELNLSGLGGKPEANAGPQTKEISATGIGITLESAEKQALASAIRQAVGAYIDSKTLVANEEVIEDRILAVSNAFVEKYEPLGEPKKTADGLFQTTILATVKTNQVVQALKENNILTGDVAGQNIYAEASTKAMNAQDAVAMLQAKFPELIKSCLTITPLDKYGNPMVVAGPDGKSTPSTEPAIRDVDTNKGSVTLTWLLEIGIDKKYYRETLFPMVKECMDAISGIPAKPAKMKLQKRSATLGQIFSDAPDEMREKWVDEIKLDWPGYPVLIKSFSKNYDACDYFWYENPKGNLKIAFKNDSGEKSTSGTRMELEVVDSNGETIAFTDAACWNPFTWNGWYEGEFRGLGYNVSDGMRFVPNHIIVLRLTIPISNAKDIKSVKIGLKVLQPVFSLQSSQN